MKTSLKALVIFVIVVHVLFFLLEAILWMQPAVYGPLIKLLNNPVSMNYGTQALVLKNLFVNQGFYNLFLAIGGAVGLRLVAKNRYGPGYALILLLCFAGTGAGIVLAASTKAYLLAVIQGGSAALTFYRAWPFYLAATRN